MRKERKHYTAEEEVAILRRHLLDKVPVPTCVRNTGCSPPCSIAGRRNFSSTELNLSGTPYYLCSVLDGYSRSIVHWDLRESMKEADIERILERAKEKYLDARPRMISDNGLQFIARDFKEFIRVSG